MKGLFENLFPTLRWKIGVTIVLVLIVAEGGFFFFASRTGQTMLQEQARLKAHGIADVMERVVEQAMLSGDSNRVQQVLDDISQSSSITNAFLVKPDGTIHRESKSSGALDGGSVTVVRGMPRGGQEQLVSAREHDSMYVYLISPLANKPGCAACHTTSAAIIGYVGFKLAAEDFRTLALDHRTLNSLMTVFIFVSLGGSMFVVLILLVIRPIQTLHSHVDRLGVDADKQDSAEATQFPLLEESHQRDEIADLCRHFNTMVRRLNAANRRIFELHNSQLEQADRLATTGQMAASMVHEIKNPVSGVLGALQVIESKLAPDDPEREIFTEMRVQLERVTKVLTDLLTYARPTPPQFDEVDVASIIEKTITLLSGQFKGKNIAILQDLPALPLVILADKKQIQQVIWNIMLNAVQAIGSTGNLSVAAEAKDLSAIIRIKDDGKGMSEEDLARVFKPFFTTKHTGTGLGMTISKRLIEMHQGSIAVASSVGRGTMVTITLPLRQERS